MERPSSGVDSVRQYLQKQIERCTARIKRAKPRRGAPGGRSHIERDLAARRAYRDALKALDGIPSGAGASAASRLAREELARVKSALARIYEVTQHANHDIAEAGDWGMVEGEAQTALNILHESERDR